LGPPQAGGGQLQRHEYHRYTNREKVGGDSWRRKGKPRTKFRTRVSANICQAGEVHVKTPSYDEAIYLATVKRRLAKQAMSKIVERYGIISNVPNPGLDVLLDYFTNMVYGIELLMKVLANDWDVPDKSKYGHDVGKMYEAIFGTPYSKSDLMRHLLNAIKDQKYIYEPGDNLLDRVPEIENLWDELKAEYYRRNYGKTIPLQKVVKMDEDFGQYLLANIERFYIPESVVCDQRTTQQKIDQHEAHIRWLQREIDRLRQCQDTEPNTLEEFEMVNRAYVEKLQGLRSCMAMNFQMWGTTELTFGTWMYTAIVSDFLG
jgi:hypothetical protein